MNNEQKINMEDGEVFLIKPVYYPGTVYINVLDKSHPMILAEEFVKTDSENISKKEDEFVFFPVTDSTHYQKGLVLKQENCFIDLDKDWPGKPSVVNCAVQYRIKKSDLKNLKTLDIYPFANNKNTKYKIGADTLCQIWDKFDEVDTRNEAAMVWIIPENKKSNVITIHKEYLNNFNTKRLKEFSKFQRKVYDSAVEVTKDKSKTLITSTTEHSR